MKAPGGHCQCETHPAVAAAAPCEPHLPLLLPHFHCHYDHVRQPFGLRAVLARPESCCFCAKQPEMQAGPVPVHCLQLHVTPGERYLACQWMIRSLPGPAVRPCLQPVVQLPMAAVSATELMTLTGSWPACMTVLPCC